MPVATITSSINLDGRLLRSVWDLQQHSLSLAGIELEQRQRDLVPLATSEEVQAFNDSKNQQQSVLDAEVKRIEELVKMQRAMRRRNWKSS